MPYSFESHRGLAGRGRSEGAANVLEAARRVDVHRVVQVSSSEGYGTAQIRADPGVTSPSAHNRHAPRPKVRERAPLAASPRVTPFRRGTVVLARPFNTYGPRQSARAVIPAVITQALLGDRIELGTTSTTRDFLFVEDTARGLARCAEVNGIEGETFNFGTGLEYSIAERGDPRILDSGRHRRARRVDGRGASPPGQQ